MQLTALLVLALLCVCRSQTCPDALTGEFCMTGWPVCQSLSLSLVCTSSSLLGAACSFFSTRLECFGTPLVFHVPCGANAASDTMFVRFILHSSTSSFLINTVNLVLTTDSFWKFSDLKTLNMRESRLTELPVGVFDRNNKLSILNFESNAIQALHSDIFINLSLLSTLFDVV